MPYEPRLPVTASTGWILGVFTFSLLVFHVVFLKLYPLTKVGWKRIDYVWLGIAALGLIAATAEVRRLVAGNLVAGERAYMAGAYDRLRDRIRFLTGPVVCRQFVRSEWSPPNLDEIQREYDRACALAQQLSRTLSEEGPSDMTSLKAAARSSFTDRALNDMFEDVDRSAEDYLKAKQRVDEFERASRERSAAEETLAISAPLLLAIALALRITKITGEIRLEA